MHDDAEKGDLETLKLLLEKGADPNVKDTHGWTPLHYAVFSGRPENGERLIGEDPLVMVSFLLENGADPNAQTERNWAIAKGSSPMHIAAQCGLLKIQKLLLEKSGDPNAKDGYDITPLHYAVTRGFLESVEFLIENNADISWREVYSAVENGHLEILRILLENGADPNCNHSENSMYAKHGLSPLMFAVMSGRFEVVKLLLEKGADPNFKIKKSLTPLKWAIKHNYSEIELLLREYLERDELQDEL